MRSYLICALNLGKINHFLNEHLEYKNYNIFTRYMLVSSHVMGKFMFK
jgi:hypothetical protein